MSSRFLPVSLLIRFVSDLPHSGNHLALYVACQNAKVYCNSTDCGCLLMEGERGERERVGVKDRTEGEREREVGTRMSDY